MASAKKYYVYIVTCCDGTLYCGITNDVEKRIATHNKRRGAKYTQSRLPVVLVYTETYNSWVEASRREYVIKQMKRTEKDKLIAKPKAD
jgi:putative endonuclease